MPPLDPADKIGAHAGQIADFVDCVREGRTPETIASDNIKSLAMVFGAAFLMAADLLARLVISPGELPIGVVTAFIGAPFFAMILRRRVVR